MRILNILLIALVISAGTVHAQTDEKQEVQKVIEALFDGMRAGDSSAVTKAFTKDAIMQTIMVNREGKPVKIEGSLERFVTAVGTPHEQVWDERIGGFEIKIDAELASVWTPYQFYAGDTFSHCGVNSFQLMKTGEGWKIFHIVDTRRTQSCVE